MPRFRYKAVNPAGEAIIATLEASDRDSAVAALRSRNLSPVSVRATSWLEPGAVRIGAKAPQLKPESLLEFTRELATLLRAGVALDAALRLASELGTERTMKAFASAVYQAVRKGASLADALVSQPIAVPAYYVGLVRAGESGGSLVDALESLSKHLAQSTKFLKELRSALYYPAFVIAVSIATVALMLLVVIPEFRPLFESGPTAPLELQILFVLSEFLKRWGWAILCALPLVLLFLRAQLSSRTKRIAWHRLVRRLPIVGSLVDRIEAARFCRTLGALHAAGTPMLQSLTIAGGAIQNQDIATRIQDSIPRFRRGENLASVVEQTSLFSSLGNRLLRVGEESGQMETMLLRLADIYDEEVRQRLTRIESMLVPTVTIIVGLFVGGIVAIMLTAILSSYDLAG
jgi:general secretion pathway protein F